jgi:phosphate:Na+ symporter
MKAGFAPLKESETFIAFFTKFNADTHIDILLCVLVGTVLTMILQSSSATVGIVMVLASQGLLTFEASVALILGDNIGTTITAQLASLGTNINAHRTANAHTLFNAFGVFIIILFFPYFVKLVVWATSSIMFFGPPDFIIDGEKPNIARYIANSHTIFNVVNALLFLMFLPFLVKTATWLTPHKEEEAELDELYQIKYMDSKFVDTPSVAIEQAKLEIIRMGESVQRMYNDAVSCLEKRSIKELSKWRKREDAIDTLQKEVTKFLIKVGQKSILPEESREISSLLRMTNNLERVGDSIENVAELIEELIEHGLHLSEGGLKDYEEISNEVRKFLDLTVSSMRREDISILNKALALEDNVNRMREEMRGNYLIRLQSGVCEVEPGLILVDMLTAFEKMGDYCFNIAQAVAGVR